MPDGEQIRQSLPDRFSKYSDLVGIIDCTEIFIDTPKDLEIQSATWSELQTSQHHEISYICAS